MDRQRIVENEKKRRVFIVTVWYLLSLLIALFVPNITFVIRYLGALAAAFMFIFPGKNLKNKHIFLTITSRKAPILIPVYSFFLIVINALKRL